MGRRAETGASIVLATIVQHETAVGCPWTIEVNGLLSADQATFEQFVEGRLPALFRYALTLTRNRHDAEDLVQEALTRVGAAWGRIRRQDDPEGYVRITMVRIMVNRWRRPRRETLVAALPENGAEDVGLARVTSVAGVDAALADLPAQMRAVLVLRYVDQMGDDQISQVLGCRPTTVRSQAARALAKLRALPFIEEHLYE